MSKCHYLLSVASLFALFSVSADQTPLVSLSANSHVCNAESEVARLAENEHLQEMAKALVEFKPTKFCFILPDSADVTILEQQPNYIKFDYKSQVLYTFRKYIITTTVAANNS